MKKKRKEFRKNHDFTFRFWWQSFRWWVLGICSRDHVPPVKRGIHDRCPHCLDRSWCSGRDRPLSGVRLQPLTEYVDERMDCWTRLNECVDASAGAAPCPFQSASLAGKNWAGVQIRLQVQFWAPTRTHMHIHKATRNYKNGTRQNEYNESHNDTTNELLPIRNQFVIALWNEKKQNNFFFSTFKKFRFSKFFFGQSHNGTSSDVDGWRQLGFVFHAATFLLAWEVLPGLRNGVVPLVAVETPPTTSSALNDWSAFSCFHRGFLFTFLCVFPPSTFSFFFF